MFKHNFFGAICVMICEKSWIDILFPSMLKTTLMAGIGGFAGTCLRYISEIFGALVCQSSFPLGTFIANMAGCLLIGAIYGYLSQSGKLNKDLNALWITGFCGGFTTFSTFSAEMLQMVEGGRYGLLAIYMASSIVLGISLVAIGSSIKFKRTLKQ